jgi:hypothetical protein
MSAVEASIPVAFDMAEDRSSTCSAPCDESEDADDAAVFAFAMLATVLATASAAAATVPATVPIAAAPAAARPDVKDEPGAAGRDCSPGVDVAAVVAAVAGSGDSPPACGGVTRNVALQRAQRARTPAAGMRAGSTRNVV